MKLSKMRMLAYAVFIAAVAILASPKGRLMAIHFDEALSAGLVRFFAGGVQMFSLGTYTDLDNSLRLSQSSSTANGVTPYTVVVSTDGRVGLNMDRSQANPSPTSGLQIGPGTGAYFAVRLSSQTSARLGSQVPGGVGEIIFNSTNGRVCVSTGTGAGAFALVGSSSAVINDGVNQQPCWGLAQ